MRGYDYVVVSVLAFWGGFALRRFLDAAAAWFAHVQLHAALRRLARQGLTSYCPGCAKEFRPPP